MNLLAETLTERPVPDWLRIVAGVAVVVLLLVWLVLHYASPVPESTRLLSRPRWLTRHNDDDEDDPDDD